METAKSRQAAQVFIDVLAYLWGMETYHSPGTDSRYRSFSLPMRDGNLPWEAIHELAIHVLAYLWGMETIMRDGLPGAKLVLAYLWGMETSSAFSKSFLVSSFSLPMRDGNCSIWTIKAAYQSVLAYLWGMETRKNLCYWIQWWVLAYLWGMETAD